MFDASQSTLEMTVVWTEKECEGKHLPARAYDVTIAATSTRCADVLLAKALEYRVGVLRIRCPVTYYGGLLIFNPKSDVTELHFEDMSGSVYHRYKWHPAVLSDISNTTKRRKPIHIHRHVRVDGLLDLLVAGEWNNYWDMHVHDEENKHTLVCMHPTFGLNRKMEDSRIIDARQSFRGPYHTAPYAIVSCTPWTDYALAAVREDVPSYYFTGGLTLHASFLLSHLLERTKVKLLHFSEASHDLSYAMHPRLLESAAAPEELVLSGPFSDRNTQALMHLFWSVRPQLKSVHFLGDIGRFHAKFPKTVERLRVTLYGPRNYWQKRWLQMSQLTVVSVEVAGQLLSMQKEDWEKVSKHAISLKRLMVKFTGGGKIVYEHVDQLYLALAQEGSFPKLEMFDADVQQKDRVPPQMEHLDKWEGSGSSSSSAPYAYAISQWNPRDRPELHTPTRTNSTTLNGRVALLLAFAFWRPFTVRVSLVNASADDLLELLYKTLGLRRPLYPTKRTDFDLRYIKELVLPKLSVKVDEPQVLALAWQLLARDATEFARHREFRSRMQELSTGKYAITRITMREVFHQLKTNVLAKEALIYLPDSPPVDLAYVRRTPAPSQYEMPIHPQLQWDKQEARKLPARPTPAKKFIPFARRTQAHIQMCRGDTGKPSILLDPIEYGNPVQMDSLKTGNDPKFPPVDVGRGWDAERKGYDLLLDTLKKDNNGLRILQQIKTQADVLPINLVVCHGRSHSAYPLSAIVTPENTLFLDSSEQCDPDVIADINDPTLLHALPKAHFRYVALVMCCYFAYAHMDSVVPVASTWENLAEWVQPGGEVEIIPILIISKRIRGPMSTFFNHPHIARHFRFLRYNPGNTATLQRLSSSAPAPTPTPAPAPAPEPSPVTAPAPEAAVPSKFAPFAEEWERLAKLHTLAGRSFEVRDAHTVDTDENVKVPPCAHDTQVPYIAVGILRLLDGSMFHGSGALFEPPYMPDMEISYALAGGTEWRGTGNSLSPVWRMSSQWALNKGKLKGYGYIYEYKLRAFANGGLPNIVTICGRGSNIYKQWEEIKSRVRPVQKDSYDAHIWTCENKYTGWYFPNYENQLMLCHGMPAAYFYLVGIHIVQSVNGKRLTVRIYGPLDERGNLLSTGQPPASPPSTQQGVVDQPGRLLGPVAAVPAPAPAPVPERMPDAAAVDDFAENAVYVPTLLLLRNPDLLMLRNEVVIAPGTPNPDLVYPSPPVEELDLASIIGSSFVPDSPKRIEEEKPVSIEEEEEPPIRRRGRRRYDEEEEAPVPPVAPASAPPLAMATEPDEAEPDVNPEIDILAGVYVSPSSPPPAENSLPATPTPAAADDNTDTDEDVVADADADDDVVNDGRAVPPIVKGAEFVLLAFDTRPDNVWRASAVRDTYPRIANLALCSKTFDTKSPGAKLELRSGDFNTGFLSFLRDNTVGVFLDYYFLPMTYYRDNYGLDWLSVKVIAAFRQFPSLFVVILPFDKNSLNSKWKLIARGGMQTMIDEEERKDNLGKAGISTKPLTREQAEKHHPLLASLSSDLLEKIEQERADPIPLNLEPDYPFVAFFRKGIDWKATLAHYKSDEKKAKQKYVVIEADPNVIERHFKSIENVQVYEYSKKESKTVPLSLAFAPSIYAPEVVEDVGSGPYVLRVSHSEYSNSFQWYFAIERSIPLVVGVLRADQPKMQGTKCSSHIHFIGVHYAQRGKDVGCILMKGFENAMMEAATKRRAAELSITLNSVFPFQSDDRAYHFYSRLGYRTHSYSNTFKVIYMGKLLLPPFQSHDLEKACKDSHAEYNKAIRIGNNSKLDALLKGVDLGPLHKFREKDQRNATAASSSSSSSSSPGVGGDKQYLVMQADDLPLYFEGRAGDVRFFEDQDIASKTISFAESGREAPNPYMYAPGLGELDAEGKSDRDGALWYYAVETTRDRSRGLIVGVLNATWIGRLTDRKDKKECEAHIYLLGVHASRRSKDIGCILMRGVERMLVLAAAELGAVELVVKLDSMFDDEADDRTYHFYSRLGYTLETGPAFDQRLYKMTLPVYKRIAVPSTIVARSSVEKTLVEEDARWCEQSRKGYELPSAASKRSGREISNDLLDSALAGKNKEFRASKLRLARVAEFRKIDSFRRSGVSYASSLSLAEKERRMKVIDATTFEWRAELKVDLTKGIHKTLWIAVDSVFVRKMIERTRLGPTDTFLDIGFGTGRLLFQVASETGAACEGLELVHERFVLASEIKANLPPDCNPERVTLQDRPFKKGDLLTATHVFANDIEFPKKVILPAIGKAVSENKNCRWFISAHADSSRYGSLLKKEFEIDAVFDVIMCPDWKGKMQHFQFYVRRRKTVASSSTVIHENRGSRTDNPWLGYGEKEEKKKAVEKEEKKKVIEVDSDDERPLSRRLKTRSPKRTSSPKKTIQQMSLKRDAEGWKMADLPDFGERQMVLFKNTYGKGAEIDTAKKYSLPAAKFEGQYPEEYKAARHAGVDGKFTILPPNLRLGPSGLHGWGVFATQRIPPFTVLGFYIGAIVKMESDVPSDYGFRVAIREKQKDAVVERFIHDVDATLPEKSSFLRYINAAPRPENQNTAFLLINREVLLHTLDQPIEVGQELLTYYGGEMHRKAIAPTELLNSFADTVGAATLLTRMTQGSHRPQFDNLDIYLVESTDNTHPYLVELPA